MAAFDGGALQELGAVIAPAVLLMSWNAPCQTVNAPNIEPNAGSFR